MLDQPFMTDIIEASSISHMPQVIDIYSASWGPTDNGKTVDGPRELTLQAMADGVNKVTVLLINLGAGAEWYGRPRAEQWPGNMWSSHRWCRTQCSISQLPAYSKFHWCSLCNIVAWLLFYDLGALCSLGWNCIHLQSVYIHFSCGSTVKMEKLDSVNTP